MQAYTVPILLALVVVSIVPASEAGPARGTSNTDLLELIETTSGGPSRTNNAKPSNTARAAPVNAAAVGAVNAAGARVVNDGGAFAAGVTQMNAAEYYAFTNAYTMTTKCYRICVLFHVFSKKAREQCNAEKEENCEKLKTYSAKEFVMYHLTHTLSLGAVLDHSHNVATKAGDALKSGTAAGMKAAQGPVSAMGSMAGKVKTAGEGVAGTATNLLYQPTSVKPFTIGSKKQQ